MTMNNNRDVEANENIPMQMVTDDTDGYDEMDYRYMLKLYPDLCKMMMMYITKLCDKMEHSGSLMYDEFPQKELMDEVIQNMMEEMMEDKAIVIQDGPTGPEEFSRRRYRNPYYSLCYALTLNEMYCRRRRYRRLHNRYPKCGCQNYYQY